MYISIIFLPFLGALLSNRWNGYIYGPYLSLLTIFLSFIFSLIAFYEIGFLGSNVSIELGKWLEYGQWEIGWTFIFDTLTVSMLIPVITISLLVQLYSINYMESDPHKIRFFSYLSIFSFFMLLLITGDNFLILFLGWEGVGLASYLLINFWFTRLAANFAALKAFLINRIGDWGFMIGILLIFSIIEDISLSNLLVLGLYLNPDLTFLLLIFLLIGAMAKSAQFGLHTWLADAMEGW
jgi:NADH-ubiquinone oxidoreductase chain 5